MSDIVMITSPGIYKMPVAQPYCLAAEAALRMGHVEFNKEVEVTERSVPRLSSDKGVWNAKDGFERILNETVLVTRSPFAKEEAALTDGQRVLKKAFIALCEKELSVVQQWLLVGKETSLSNTKVEYRKFFSFFRKYLLPSVESELTRSHTELAKDNVTLEKVLKIVDHVCQAIADQLGSKNWLLGTSAPTVVDAVVFGFVGSILYPSGVPRKPASFIISDYPVIVDYMERIRQRYFEIYSLSFFLRRLDDLGTAPASPPSTLSAKACCLATTASAAYFLTTNIEFLVTLLEG